ncbi:MAG: two-component regulator propeller domain-containing protein [Bacteroidota bacterium]
MRSSRRCVRLRALCLGLGLLTTVSTQAQPSALTFRHLTLDEGLPTYVTLALHRTKDGYLLAGHAKGLSRYDGVRVRTWSADSLLVDDRFKHVIEGREGEIWAATRNGGLVRGDASLGVFDVFSPENGRFPSYNVEALAGDSEGGIWAATGTEGLFRYDDEADRFETVAMIRTAERAAGLSDSVRVIVHSPTANRLWVGTNRGLELYAKTSNGVAQQTHGWEPLADLAEVSVTTVREHGEAVWFGTRQGQVLRYRFDIRQVDTLVTAAYGISTIVPSSLYPGLWWIGTLGSGLIAYDSRTGQSSNHTHDSNRPSSLQHTRVHAILEDQEGVLWVGTNGGISYKGLRRPRFTPIRLGPPFPVDTQTPNTLALYQSPSDTNGIWVGTEAGSLYRYDLETQQFAPGFGRERPPVFIVALHEDQAGALWVAGRFPQIYRLNPQTGTSRTYSIGTSVRTVVQDIHESAASPGHLWLATHDSGLLRFDTASGQVIQRYTADRAPQRRLSSNEIMAIYEDPLTPGVLWLPTIAGGLNRLDIRLDSVSVVATSSPSAPCPPRDLLAVRRTTAGTLWLGTYRRGLVAYDEQAGQCRFFGTEAGLPSQDVSALYEDGLGRLWMLTSNGLAVFDPATEHITVFTEEDGLQDMIFHYQAHHQTKTGAMIVGGALGFNYFHPDRIQLDAHPPHVVISALRIDGEPHPLPAAQAPRLVLDYQRNDITIDYAALSLASPGRNRYRVMLEGDDETWDPVTAATTKEYANLAPGSYTFRVAGAGSEGAWNMQGAALSFRIRPPVWGTWWFWALLTGSLMGLVAGAYQYRLQQLRTASQVISRNRREIADDLHDDLGGKISYVGLRLELTAREATLGADDEARFAALVAATQGVGRDLGDWLSLIDDSNQELARVLDLLKQAAKRYLVGKQVSFAVSTPLPNRFLDMNQRKHLYLLFRESVSNISRHSQATHVEVDVAWVQEQLVVTVTDNGVGFDLSDSTHGRGQRTMRRRAEALGGALHIQSNPGIGTTLVISVPVPGDTPRWETVLRRVRLLKWPWASRSDS